jgi:hypothetical protein
MQWAEARQPAESPKKTLQTMNNIAAEGLGAAATHGIKPGPEVDDLNRQLSPTRVDMTAVQGKEYWQGRIKLNQEVLVTQVSAFVALLQMRDKCEAGKKEKDNSGLMMLVKRATERECPESLWKLFTETYAVTWTEKIKIAWIYWIYYQTSLIANTVRAYLGSFIANIQSDLTSDNSTTRNLVFSKALENMKAALIADNKAKENFANKMDHRTLEAWQNQFIEEVYNGGLQELCKKFSEKRVSQYSPTVRILEEWQKIKVIGWIFKKFESLVNHFIQSNMQSILPDALKETVENGLKATQPHHLPFALGLTQFFTSQLTALNKELELELKGKGTPTTTRFFEAGELSPVVKELIKALDLETNEKYHPPTSAELKNQITEIDSGEKDPKPCRLGRKLDQMVEESIEEGLEEGGNLLFNYLDGITKSGELFAKLLELSSAPFSGEFKDAETLKAEYAQEQKKLEDLGEEIVAKIVTNSIDKTVKGADPEKTREIAQESYRDGQTVASKTMDKLTEICTRMTETIAIPGQEKNVQTDIASILKIMQIFADREEIHDEIAKLDATDQNAIWQIVTPLYKRAVKIVERLLCLQTLLTDPNHADMTRTMGEISNDVKDLSREIKDAQANIYAPLPPLWAKKLGFAVIGGAIGVSLPLLGGSVGSLLGPVGTFLGTALGTTASASIYPVAHHLSGLRNTSPDTGLKAVAAATPFAAASYLFGFPFAMASGAAAGLTYDKAMQAYGRGTVRPRVDRIVKNANIFLKSPRVWKSLATRTLKELS